VKRRPLPLLAAMAFLGALALLAALAFLGACGGDNGTEPSPPPDIFTTHQATWSLTHGSITGTPNDSCGSSIPVTEEDVSLRSGTFMDGSWRGRTFTGAWTHHVQIWDEFTISGTLVATIGEGDSLLTSFTVDQHIVWILAPDLHRHEIAHVEYDGPGLRLGDENWGYIFRAFGEECCEGLSIHWQTWLEEHSACTYTAENLDCADVSSLHVGFYPRD